jgi:hypothetical protein
MGNRVAEKVWESKKLSREELDLILENRGWGVDDDPRFE